MVLILKLTAICQCPIRRLMTAEMIKTELRDHLVRRSAWGKGHKINVSYQLRFSSFVRYQLKLGPFAVIC